MGSDNALKRRRKKKGNLAASVQRARASKREREGRESIFTLSSRVTPDLSSTCAHHVLVRRSSRVRSGDGCLSRKSDWKDRSNGERAALSLRLSPGVSMICLLTLRGRLIFLNARHSDAFFARAVLRRFLHATDRANPCQLIHERSATIESVCLSRSI